MSDKRKLEAEALYNRLLKYCDDCLHGKIVVCKKHRWAIERFYKDLKNPKYYFDKMELLKFYYWAKSFKHRAGVLAGKPIQLTDFSLFEVGNLLCLKKTETKRRKYKKAYLQRARKNAKVLAC